MKISPPIAVLAIAAVGIAVTVWLVPAQRQPVPQAKVSLSAEKQEDNVLWTNFYLSKDRKLPTTDQISDTPPIKTLKETEIPANRTGPRVN